MKYARTRRQFLATLPAFAAIAQSKPLKITAVEIWELRGHAQSLRGVDQQYQVNPLYIYDELRPKPYADSPNPTSQNSAVTALYLNIKTNGDAEGLYGPIDKEVAIVVDEQLRPFLMGKDALAQEELWDQLYRSNRHSRRGFFLMAISAVDNTLWDLRGRHFKTPVYRLLGGPTRQSIEAYASCLGYSLELDKVQTRAAALKKEGYRYQKWFLAYGPGDGPEGMKKNVDLVRVLRETVGDDTELMFDVYSGWDLSYALAWAKRVEQYRQLRATPQRHVHPGGLGGTHPGPMGSVRLPEGRRAQRGAVRSGMVRRALRIAENLHRGVRLRRTGDSARPQSACRPAPDRQPVAGRLPAGGISYFEDAGILPLRKKWARAASRAFRASGGPWLRH